MAFHVNWKTTATNQLTELWSAATDRAELARAAEMIDRTLREHPISFGESRGGNLRLAFALPWVVMFEIFADDLRIDEIAVKRLSQMRG